MLADSVDLTAAARSVQLFKIGGFTATKEKPGYTASRVCAVGGHDWRIGFHPKMSHPTRHYSGNDWIMFRLRLISEGASGVAASFSCRLMDPTSPGSSLDPEEITSSVFHENDSLDASLIKWSDVKGSERRYLKDDCILVQCAINVLPCKPKDPPPVSRSAEAVAAYASPKFPSADLHQQLGDLLRTGTGADITFVVAGESVAAHRSVLAARSSVFMAELFGDMKGKASQCVEIEDMEAEVFRAMLRFIYTDTVPELDIKLNGEQATAMAQHLLEAADRYGLNRLKRICVEKVCTTIDVDTVAATLALAEQHGCAKLKARCISSPWTMSLRFLQRKGSSISRQAAPPF